MATVWAPHRSPNVGNWVDRAYGSGWSATIRFDTLDDLAVHMNERGLGGTVTALGIVAHGDRPGVVQLDHALTATSIPSFSTGFDALDRCLTQQAKLVFFSCIAGRDSDGSGLLMALSTRLRGRAIIGFEVFGWVAANVPSDPGQMLEDPFGWPGPSAPAPNPAVIMTPWGKFAKWALDGRIIRYPLFEQSRRPNKKCANPACPGHCNALHQCSRWFPGCEW